MSKTHCPTCNHIIANPIPAGLSSIEFRRHVNGIKNLDELVSFKEYAVRFVGSFHRDGVKANDFLEKLEEKIESNIDVSNIKAWMLSYINNAKEFPLFQFLKDFYYQDGEGINETFIDFYNIYYSSIDIPLSKNKMSRALSAFGLKTVIKKITVVNNQVRTNCVKIIASAEELAELIRMNGLL